MLVEFRDGKREVPDHLAELMGGIETYKLTYAQALEEANKVPLRDLLSKTQSNIVHDHFRLRGSR